MSRNKLRDSAALLTEGGTPTLTLPHKGGGETVLASQGGAVDDELQLAVDRLDVAGG